MNDKSIRCRDFKKEFGSPQKTRTVDIAQTVADVYGYWYDGTTFMIIRRDQKGRYDPVDARYISQEEFCILDDLSVNRDENVNSLYF